MSASVDANEAGLRYVSDKAPGLSRKRRKDGFTFHNPDGSNSLTRKASGIPSVQTT